MKGKGKGMMMKGKGKKGLMMKGKGKGFNKGKGKGKGLKGKGKEKNDGCFICGSQEHWAMLKSCFNLGSNKIPNLSAWFSKSEELAASQ